VANTRSTGPPRICPAWSSNAILTLQHSHRKRSDGALISIQTAVARAGRQSGLAWLEIYLRECGSRRADIRVLPRLPEFSGCRHSSTNPTSCQQAQSI
jgi:hypothetical protein